MVAIESAVVDGIESAIGAREMPGGDQRRHMHISHEHECDNSRSHGSRISRSLLVCYDIPVNE